MIDFHEAEREATVAVASAEIELREAAGGGTSDEVKLAVARYREALARLEALRNPKLALMNPADRAATYTGADGGDDVDVIRADRAAIARAIKAMPHYGGLRTADDPLGQRRRLVRSDVLIEALMPKGTKEG